MNRTGLIALQLVGALSILPYPFVLLANVMSLAAPGQTAFGAIPFLLLSIYPAIWIALYVISWRALARGATGWAFGLSSVPVLAGAGLVGMLAFSSVSSARFRAGAVNDVRKKMESVNPMVWTIWCTGNEHHFPSGPTVPVDEAIRAIEAHPEMVNIAVPSYGTPLAVAVDNLLVDLTGSPIRFNGSPAAAAQHEEDLVRMVRTLVAHGAQLAPDEKTNLVRRFRFKIAMHDGPITTASENPLVWRILTRKRDGVTLFSLRDDEKPLLNKSTQLHGTPLYAALLQDGPDAYRELILAGAHLSNEEDQNPAAAAALAHVLDRDLELKRAYDKK